MNLTLSGLKKKKLVLTTDQLKIHKNHDLDWKNRWELFFCSFYSEKLIKKFKTCTNIIVYHKIQFKYCIELLRRHGIIENRNAHSDSPTMKN